MTADELVEILNGEEGPVSVEEEILTRSRIPIGDVCKQTGRLAIKETIVVEAEQPGIMPILSELIRFDRKEDS